MTRIITSIIFLATVAFGAFPQAMYIESAKVGGTTAKPEPAVTENPVVATPTATSPAIKVAKLKTDSAAFAPRSLEELDAYLDSIKYIPCDTLVGTLPLPQYFFRPLVFDHHRYQEKWDPFTPDFSGKPEMRWFEEQVALHRTMNMLNDKVFYTQPELVRYNIDLLPEAPKQYHAVVDPSKHTIEIRELDQATGLGPTFEAPEVKKRHWIRSFNASLHFSQAYVSPNWYQGGNNNLNTLANIYYNVKLNTEYHPNLLFETTAQYKLGMNNAPDDSIHNYNISDDLLQINTTFGIKAAKRWYYSFTGQFKTQVLNSYKKNSHDLNSSFLSPGELTAGIGMTYNYANGPKTFTFDASIAPLSYNLKTCTSNRIDPAAYNIKEGHKTSHNFGSSAELRLFWKLAYNITFSSRIFAFTDYDSAQADWENTLSFDINRFLSTQVYVHLRYDSATPPCEDENWKKLQVKEILSIGFAYKFSSI